MEVFVSDEEIWGKIGVVGFETVPGREEVSAVREVMGRIEREGRGKGFWVSFVFPGETDGDRGFRLPDGSTVEEVVRAMLEEGEEKGKMARPMGIGINCTKVGKVSTLVQEFEKEVGRLLEEEGGDWPALVIYPDGSREDEVFDVEAKEWKMVDVGEGRDEVTLDEKIFEIVKGVKERGLWKEIFEGGCCKTGPEDIGRLKGRLDGRLDGLL